MTDITEMSQAHKFELCPVSLSVENLLKICYNGATISEQVRLSKVRRYINGVQWNSLFLPDLARSSCIRYCADRHALLGLMYLGCDEIHGIINFELQRFWIVGFVFSVRTRKERPTYTCSCTQHQR
jgi:hypothetical protein